MERRPSFSNHTPGFAWIPFLFVCVVSIVFCVVIIVVLRPSCGSNNRKQTLITLRNICLKNEEYANEHNGIYPVGEDGSSAVFYRALSGDKSGLGKAPTGPVYWEDLNRPKNSHLVGSWNGKKVILDGFGNSLRYRSACDQNKQAVKGIVNKEDFDLWSTGPDGEPSDFSIPGTFQSEETEGDIWP